MRKSNYKFKIQLDGIKVSIKNLSLYNNTPDACYLIQCLIYKRYLENFNGKYINKEELSMLKIIYHDELVEITNEINKSLKDYYLNIRPITIKELYKELEVYRIFTEYAYNHNVNLMEIYTYKDTSNLKYH